MLSANVTAVLYVISAVLFILALRGLSSPETSRQGNFLGMTGMAIAIATTLLTAAPGAGGLLMILAGLGIGGAIGAVTAKRVPMTAMPQLVAAFHSLVGMAAVFVAAGALYAPQAFGIGVTGQIPGASLVEMSIGVAIVAPHRSKSARQNVESSCHPHHQVFGRRSKVDRQSRTIAQT